MLFLEVYPSPRRTNISNLGVLSTHWPLVYGASCSFYLEQHKVWPQRRFDTGHRFLKLNTDKQQSWSSDMVIKKFLSFIDFLNSHGVKQIYIHIHCLINHMSYKWENHPAPWSVFTLTFCFQRFFTILNRSEEFQADFLFLIPRFQPENWNSLWQNLLKYVKNTQPKNLFLFRNESKQL